MSGKIAQMQNVQFDLKTKAPGCADFELVLRHLTELERIMKGRSAFVFALPWSAVRPVTTGFYSSFNRDGILKVKGWA